MMDYGKIAFQELMEQIEEQGFTSNIRLFLEQILKKDLIERTVNLMYKEAKIEYHTAILSERSFWTFNTHNTTYYVFVNHENDSYFCSCPSYDRDVIREYRYPFCKHILAAFLCDILRKRNETDQIKFLVDEMNDDEFAEFLAKTVFQSSFVIDSKKK